MDIKLFALNSTKKWGEHIAQYLPNITLAPHEERDFEDGEHKIRPLENVRNKDVFVVQSLFSDPTQSVNDKLCRFLFFIGALKDASAQRITAVIPYFAYARKDRKTKTRDPITMRYMAQLIESMGAHHILTMDIHNLAAFQNAFRVPTDHLEATLLFAPYFAKQLKNEKVVVVSPDAGGLKRADSFCELLSSYLKQSVEKAFLNKKRSAGVVSGGSEVIGAVRGKVAIIIDDIISSGKTIELAATALHKQGAKKIFACASHGLFVGSANKVVANPLIEKIIITNSVPPFRLPQHLLHEKVEILDASLMFAKAIQAIHEGSSINNISALF